MLHLFFPEESFKYVSHGPKGRALYYAHIASTHLGQQQYHVPFCSSSFSTPRQERCCLAGIALPPYKSYGQDLNLTPLIILVNRSRAKEEKKGEGRNFSHLIILLFRVRSQHAAASLAKRNEVAIEFRHPLQPRENTHTHIRQPKRSRKESSFTFLNLKITKSATSPILTPHSFR